MTKRTTYKLLILVVLTIAPLILSCGHREDISFIIERADALSKDNPEEAMALIVYYDYGNNHDMRANAYYQHALSQKRDGNYPLAILALNGVINALCNYDDPLLEAETYRTMGEIYYETHLFDNSYKAYSMAAECYERAEMEEKSHMAQYNMGRSAFKLYRYDEAKELLNSTLAYSYQSNNMELRGLALHQLCDIHLYNKDYEALCNTVEMFNMEDSSMGDISHYHCMMAIYYTLKENIACATQHLAHAKECPTQNSNSIKYTEYYINRYTKNETESIKMLEENIRMLEEIILKNSKHPMLNQEIEFLKEHIDSINYRDKIEDNKNRAYLIALSIIILMLIHILISIRGKMRRDTQQYIDTINELQLTRHNTSKELEPLVTAIDHLYNDRLRDINQLCETYYDHSNTPSQTTKVFERVRQTIEAISNDEARLRELEELVDRCRNGLMSKLREECKKLNERELKVALYSYAGFSSRAICIFIDSNPVALSKMKYRIKTKIKEAECESAEILIAALN